MRAKFFVLFTLAVHCSRAFGDTGLAGFETEVNRKNPKQLEEIVEYLDFGHLKGQGAFERLLYNPRTEPVLLKALSYGLQDAALQRLYPRLPLPRARARILKESLPTLIQKIDLERDLKASAKAEVLASLTWTCPQRDPDALSKLVPMKKSAPEWMKRLLIEVDQGTIEFKLAQPTNDLLKMPSLVEPLAQALGIKPKLWSMEVLNGSNFHIHLSSPQIGAEAIDLAELYQDLIVARVMDFHRNNDAFKISGSLFDRHSLGGYQFDTAERGPVRMVEFGHIEVRLLTLDLPSQMQELHDLFVTSTAAQATSQIEAKIKAVLSKNPNLLNRLVELRPDIAWRFLRYHERLPSEQLKPLKRQVLKAMVLSDDPEIFANLRSGPSEEGLLESVLGEMSATNAREVERARETLHSRPSCVGPAVRGIAF